MYCKACGKPIESDWSVCVHCGRPIGMLSGGTGFWDIASNDIRPRRDTGAEQKGMFKEESNSGHSQRTEGAKITDNSAQPQGASAGMKVNRPRNDSMLRDRQKKSGKRPLSGLLSSLWNGKNGKRVLLGLCAVLLLFIIAGLFLTMRLIAPKRAVESSSYGDLNAAAGMEQLNEPPFSEEQKTDSADHLREELEAQTDELKERIEALEVENGELQERLKTDEDRQYYIIEILKRIHEIGNKKWDKTLEAVKAPDGLMDIPEPVDSPTSVAAESPGPSPYRTTPAMPQPPQNPKDWKTFSNTPKQ